VARVDLVGGRTPEYHVIVDPLRLNAARLSLAQVTDALINTNLVSPSGMHEENAGVPRLEAIHTRSAGRVVFNVLRGCIVYRRRRQLCVV
jgi:Cu/Ag efflux pump CusA